MAKTEHTTASRIPSPSAEWDLRATATARRTSGRCASSSLFRTTITGRAGTLISTDLMLVSRAVRLTMLPKLYERNFSMQCSPRGIVAFLKDHSSVGLERLILHFNSLDDHDEHWRELMRFIPHGVSQVKEIQLVVGEFFWTAMGRWEGRALPLIKPLRFTRKGDEERWRWAVEQPNHFLRDFRRIAIVTPVKRKCFDFKEGDPKRREDGGTKTSIEMAGAATAEKAVFVKDFNYGLGEFGRRRPRFVVINDEEYTYRNPKRDMVLWDWI